MVFNGVKSTWLSHPQNLVIILCNRYLRLGESLCPIHSVSLIWTITIRGIEQANSILFAGWKECFIVNHKIYMLVADVLLFDYHPWRSRWSRRPLVQSTSGRQDLGVFQRWQLGAVATGTLTLIWIEMKLNTVRNFEFANDSWKHI